MIVYLLTNVINGKQYIGKTVGDLNSRWSRHKYDARTRRCSTHLGRAIQKYGAENFSKVILAEAATQEELAIFEQEFITAYQTRNQYLGYNLTDGGEGSIGFRHTEDTKRILRNQKLGKRGHPNSLYQKIRCAESNRNRVWTPKMRHNRGESQRGVKNHRFGKHISETQRNLLSQMWMGANNPNSKENRMKRMMENR